MIELFSRNTDSDGTGISYDNNTLAKVTFISHNKNDIHPYGMDEDQFFINDFIPVFCQLYFYFYVYVKYLFCELFFDSCFLIVA